MRLIVFIRGGFTLANVCKMANCRIGIPFKIWATQFMQILPVAHGIRWFGLSVILAVTAFIRLDLNFGSIHFLPE